MMTVEFITALFYEVDEQIGAIPKHPEAHLWPSKGVTLGLLHALKGVGNRAFYRWLTRDFRPLFPLLPERTRLFRLLPAPPRWAQGFPGAAFVAGGIRTVGHEANPPQRQGRHPPAVGRKGLSQPRLVCRGQLCLLPNSRGLVVGGGHVP